MAPKPIVRSMTPDDRNRLLSLFRRIDCDRYRSDFAPHPFTEAEAERVCYRPGKDVYVGVSLAGDVLIGYGMARGWEDGFEVPSLGLCIVEQCQGLGAGRALMSHLLAACRTKGASQVMLKVKRNNKRARRLYRRSGFELESFNDDFLVGYLAF